LSKKKKEELIMLPVLLTVTDESLLSKFLSNNLRSSLLSLKSVMLIAITLLFSIILLSACSGSTDEAPIEQKSRVTVDFSTFQVEVEDMGRGSRAALSTAATRLSFAVFKSDGTQVYSAHQSSGDANFGSVKLELYPGDYKMVAVAHNGTADADIKLTYSATLPGHVFTDTFAKVQSLSVKSVDCNFTMELGRITSAFILKCTDTPPANAKRIKVVVNADGTEPTSLEINPTTGWVTGDWNQVRTISISDISKGVPIYFIGESQEVVVDVVATATDANGDVIFSRTLKDIPLKTNQKTIATGTFFQSSGSGTFTVNSEWLNDNNIEY
jgi:hypothetical protein